LSQFRFFRNTPRAFSQFMPEAFPKIKSIKFDGSYGKRFLLALVQDELGLIRIFVSVVLHHLLHCGAERIGLAAWQIVAFDICLAALFIAGLCTLIITAIAGALRTCLRTLLKVLKEIRRFKRARARLPHLPRKVHHSI
jgi:hypothetical protein